MAYGTIKVDQVTFTNGGVDQTISVSGIVQSISGDITATGTIQGATIIGTSTVSGATVTGDTGSFTTATAVTGVFTTSVSGSIISGDTGRYTTLTGISGVFTGQVSGATITGDVGQYATLTGISGVFTTSISGVTVTGDAGNFTTLTGGTGVFTTSISGASITGGVATITSGVFALGTNALPSISFSSDPDTGIYSPGADQVAISTNGQGRLFIDSNGYVGIGAVNTGSAGAQLATSTALTTARLVVESTNAAGYPGYRLVNGTGNWEMQIDGSNQGLRFLDDSTERLRITSTGELKHIGGGSEGSPGVYFAGSAPSNSLVVQATTGNVGLGTNNPSTNLEISSSNSKVRITDNDSASSGNCSLEWAFSGGRNGYMGYGGSNDLYIWQELNNKIIFGTNATSALTIDASQRVGIGTTSPTAKLNILGDYGQQLVLQQVTTNSVAKGGLLNTAHYTNAEEPLLVSAGYSSSTENICYYGGGWSASNAATSLQFYTAANTTTTTGTERARIDSSGTFRVKGAGTAGTTDAVQLNGSAPANSLLLDASGRLLVGTTGSTATGTAVIQAERTQVIGRSATNVAAGSTASIVLSTTSGLYHGFLSVCVVNSTNASVSTSTTYSIFGRGSTSSIQQIASNNGTGGARAFSVATPSAMTIEVTNNAASNSNIYISFFGSLAA